jgi:hypothetical protein
VSAAPWSRSSIDEVAAQSLARGGAALLARIAAVEDGVPLANLIAELDAEAWLAIARLVRAGLLDENGLRLYTTESGDRWSARLQGEASRIGAGRD